MNIIVTRFVTAFLAVAQVSSTTLASSDASKFATTVTRCVDLGKAWKNVQSADECEEANTYFGRTLTRMFDHPMENGPCGCTYHTFGTLDFWGVQGGARVTNCDPKKECRFINGRDENDLGCYCRRVSPATESLHPTDVTSAPTISSPTTFLLSTSVPMTVAPTASAPVTSAPTTNAISIVTGIGMVSILIFCVVLYKNLKRVPSLPLQEDNCVVNTEEVVTPAPPVRASYRRASSPVLHYNDAASTETFSSFNSAKISSAGATVIHNPLSAESVAPTLTSRQSPVPLFVTDAIVVDPTASTGAPSAPITDPLCDALEVVDGFSTLYLELGPVTMSLSILQDALADAVACCDGAIDGPPADLPPLGEDSLGNALKYLAGVSSLYRKFGSERVPIPVVREALEKAMVHCW